MTYAPQSVLFAAKMQPSPLLKSISSSPGADSQTEFSISHVRRAVSDTLPPTAADQDTLKLQMTSHKTPGDKQVGLRTTKDILVPSQEPPRSREIRQLAAPSRVSGAAAAGATLGTGCRLAGFSCSGW